MHEFRLSRRFVLLGITLAASYWLIEAYADFVWGEGPVAHRLLPADANEIWMRLIIVSLILGFTGYVSNTVYRRTRIEEKLRMLQSAVHHTHDAVLVTTAAPDPLGSEIVYVNEALCRQTGYAAEELLGKTPRMLQGPDAEREVFDRLRRCLDSEQHFTGCVTNYRKDGSTLRVDLRVSPVYDPPGELTHWIFVQRDITEREQIEAALKESEERFRVLVQNSSDITVILDSDGTILYESPAVERMLGFSPEERIGTNAFEYMHPEDRERVSAAFGNVLKEPGAQGTVGYRVRDKWGSWRHFEAIGTNLLEEPSIRGIVVNTRDVTERKQAEESLRQAEEKYRSIFENAAEGIFQTYASGRIVTANPAAARLLGYDSPEEMIENVSDVSQHFVVPDDRTLFYRLIQQEDTVSDFEHQMYRRDGTPIWVSVTARALRDQDGKLSGFEGVVEDVTERKKAEEALRESEERYRAVVEQSAEGIYLIDARTKRIIESNSTLRQMLGYTASELDDMELYELAASPREKIDSNFRRTLKEGHRITGATEYWRKDGTLLDVEVSASVICYGGEDVVCGVVRDITERKRAERRLREAEEGYRTLVEQVPAVIYTQELSEPSSPKSSTTMFASPQIEAQTGYPPLAYVEDPELWIKLVHPEDREQVLAEDARTDEIGEPFRMEYRYITRHGRVIWVRDEAMLVRDESGQPLYWQGIQQDITQRKRAESALREVREAERRQIARDLHDGVLQELMDALYSMQVTRLRLRDEGINIPEIDEQIDDLRNAAQGLREAINNLHHRNVLEQSFLQLLRSVVEANRQKAPQIEIGLDVDASFSSEPLEGTKMDLLRIVQEALVNVRRHSEAHSVKVNLREDQDLVIEVVDDGRGFDPEMAWGGIGLSSMQERALKLGADLHIESAPGRGTRVVVVVPAELARAADDAGHSDIYREG